jgi:hypothetical protein
MAMLDSEVDRKGGAGSWVLGAVVGLVGMIGLFLASRADDATLYWVGMLIFLFAVLFVFNLIVAHTGNKDH